MLPKTIHRFAAAIIAMIYVEEDTLDMTRQLRRCVVEECTGARTRPLYIYNNIIMAMIMIVKRCFSM